LPLPRRERRILEYLVMNKGRRVTKSQIFNSVYGLFGESIDENVVESHISKLRKRLRQRIGYDAIDSQRYLGYRLIDQWSSGVALGEWPRCGGRPIPVSPVQGRCAVIEGEEGTEGARCNEPLRHDANGRIRHGGASQPPRHGLRQYRQREHGGLQARV